MDPLLIHIHVPKCAGTTVEEHLERQLGKVGFWSPPKRSRKVPLEIFGRKYHAIPPGRPEQVREIWGILSGAPLKNCSLSGASSARLLFAIPTI